MSAKTKFSVFLLAASAAFFMSLENREGNVSKPYHDSGGVVTQGIGSTTKPDGTKIKITDPAISKETAREWAKAYVSKDEITFKNSLAGVKLSQAEYDLYLDFSYQYGYVAWRNSSMRKLLIQNKHRQSCDALLEWRKVTINGVKHDCRIRSNNCYGVWTRQLERHKKCIEVN